MDIQTRKINIYFKRSFGDKLNATFDFIKQNPKILIKYIVYFLLPVSLIQSFTTNSFMGSALSLEQTFQYGEPTGMLYGLGISYLGTILLNIIGTLLLTSTIYALMRIYEEREQKLQGITWEEIRPRLFHNIKRMLLLTVVTIILLIIVAAAIAVMAYISKATLILTIPAFLATLIAYTFLPCIYLFEDISFGDAFTKTFRLGFRTWGGTFGIIIIMGLIASILQGVTTTPWYVATLVKTYFSVASTGNSFTSSAGFNFLMYLLGIIQSFGSYLAGAFTLIGIAYQYGHASEVVDNKTVGSDISNFENL